MENKVSGMTGKVSSCKMILGSWKNSHNTDLVVDLEAYH